MTVRIATGIVVGLAVLGGCADLMGRSVVAPDWFEAKAEEVKGQGYPDLYAVPQAQEITPRADWAVVARDLQADAAPLREGAQEDVPTSAEIRARAAQLRAGVTVDPEPDSDTQ